jgi:hypothetical protein
MSTESIDDLDFAILRFGNACIHSSEKDINYCKQQLLDLIKQTQLDILEELLNIHSDKRVGVIRAKMQELKK